MNHSKRVEWSRLDNASKYFAATYSEKDEKVFRLSCEFFEEVDPEILQQALDETIERFPYYRSVLRRGIFWYYLENSDIDPLVEKEDKPVCAPIYRKYERKLLFRVLYYNKRISIEVFHALSDGTGALRFMMTLVYYYLLIKYRDEFSDQIPELSYNASISEKKDDSFNRYYQGRHFKKQVKSKKEKKKSKKVYRLKGTRFEENRVKIIEGTMSAKAVLDEAHKYNTTMTVFLSAILLRSIYMDMPVRKKDYSLVLSVPINLRQYFKSETASNFFSTMNIEYNFGKGSMDLSEVIESLNESFRKELTEERLNEHLNWQMSIEKNLFARVLPLPLKNLFVRIADEVVERRTTACISNLGRIQMPSQFNGYIRQFIVVPNVRRPQLAVCSYGDKMVVTFGSPFEETEVLKNFFKSLSEMGIKIEISSNM